MKNYVGLRKDKLLYLPGFQSAKRFGQDRVEYPDYYSNRRMKAKWKGLPPVIHRQQAPLTAGTIALIIIIYPLGDTSVQRGRLSTSVLLLQPLCKFLLIDQVVHSRSDVWKEIFVLQHILQGLSGSVCREH